MGCKVVLIGGGSYNWTPTLAKDLFLREGLASSELVLVDIDKEAAEIMKSYCEKMIDSMGTGWEITVADLESALKGADLVCISISTGGLEAMSHDYHIPEEFGIYHTVGDTVGPGGISRTLRNIPVFVDIATKMEKYCPEAWLIHVTNPLSQLTRAVNKETSIKCVGLCHNYAGTASFLASYFDVDVEDIDAASVGVNHYTWLKNITCKGKPVTDKLSLEKYLKYEAEKEGPLESNTTDDDIEAKLGDGVLNYYLNFELYERFGWFPVGSSCHVAENLPFYCNNLETLKNHHIRRKGVLPMRREQKEEKQQEILDIINGKKELPEFNLSREGLSGIVESLYTGNPSRSIVAMANKGQVSNLPEGVIVETWAEISASGISPVISGPIPEPLTGYMQMIVDEQETTVAAALTGKRDLVLQVMHVSPQIQNKDIIEELTDRLLEANKEYLPQFF